MNQLPSLRNTVGQSSFFESSAGTSTRPYLKVVFTSLYTFNMVSAETVCAVTAVCNNTQQKAIRDMRFIMLYCMQAFLFRDVVIVSGASTLPYLFGPGWPRQNKVSSGCLRVEWR